MIISACRQEQMQVLTLHMHMQSIMYSGWLSSDAAGAHCFFFPDRKQKVTNQPKKVAQTKSRDRRKHVHPDPVAPQSRGARYSKNNRRPPRRSLTDLTSKRLRLDSPFLSHWQPNLFHILYFRNAVL
jgi:hypothetical protein